MSKHFQQEQILAQEPFHGSSRKLIRKSTSMNLQLELEWKLKSQLQQHMMILPILSNQVLAQLRSIMQLVVVFLVWEKLESTLLLAILIQCTQCPKQVKSCHIAAQAKLGVTFRTDINILVKLQLIKTITPGS